MKWPLVLVASLVAGCSGAPAGSTTWHVDFENGSNRADGKTPATAWKHAPGDAEADGGPANVALKPGDRVLFRAGVPYRGSITIPASGTAEAPITYSGLGWGEGMGIIDGSDPVRSARPCTSAADCGGAEAWQGLHRIEFDVPPTNRIVLFGEGGLYWVGQLPALDEPFFSDAIRNFQVIPKSQSAQLQTGVLHSPELATFARKGGRLELALWVKPNLVRRRAVTRVEGDKFYFDPAKLEFYADRDSRAALIGSFASLTKEGSYAELEPGLLIAKLRPTDSAATLGIGSARVAFDLKGHSHIRIQGLRIRNLSGARSARREGVGVGAFASGSTDIVVRGNHFGPALLEQGGGIILLTGTDNVRLLENRIEDIALGSGLRTGGKNQNLRVEGNVIRKIGRTAITLFSVNNAVIKGNMLFDVKGVHGNGITVYLANKNILVKQNCVVNSSRPMTFHGDRNPDASNDIRIIENIFISQARGQAAINSWGASTVDVLIEGNILAGPKMGLKLQKSDRNVRVLNNITGPIAYKDLTRADWQIEGNREDFTLADAAKGSFSEDSCSIPSSGSPLRTERSRAR